MIGTIFDRLAKSTGPELIDLIEGISGWVLSLQGCSPLLTGLGRLRDSLGAEAAVLTRLGRTDGAGTSVLVSDVVSIRADGEPVERSFAAGLLGSFVYKPRTGSAWFTEPADVDQDPALRSLYRRRRLSEMAVVVLQVEEKAIYFLELHFKDSLASDGRALASNLAGSLSDMWLQRATGRFSEALLKSRPSTVAEDGRKGVPVEFLSVDNPAQLSRAEFRVCSLLSSGMNTSRVCEELGITDSTVRTHLRQIYQKTGSSNMADLLFKLLACDLPTTHRISADLRRTGS